MQLTVRSELPFTSLNYRNHINRTKLKNVYKHDFAFCAALDMQIKSSHSEHFCVGEKGHVFPKF